MTTFLYWLAGTTFFIQPYGDVSNNIEGDAAFSPAAKTHKSSPGNFEECSKYFLYDFLEHCCHFYVDTNKNPTQAHTKHTIILWKSIIFFLRFDYYTEHSIICMVAVCAILCDKNAMLYCAATNIVRSQQWHIYARLSWNGFRYRTKNINIKLQHHQQHTISIQKV